MYNVYNLLSNSPSIRPMNQSSSLMPHVEKLWGKVLITNLMFCALQAVALVLLFIMAIQ